LNSSFFRYVIISRTDVVCYFLIILNLMLKASILALVLPLAVFLWATFVIPRPAKYFWTFAIVYLEVIMVLILRLTFRNVAQRCTLLRFTSVLLFLGA